MKLSNRDLLLVTLIVRTPSKPVIAVFTKAAKESFLYPLASAQRAEEWRKLLEKEVIAHLFEAAN